MDRHPGTLFSGVARAGSRGGSWLAMYKSCLYLSFSSGIDPNARVMDSSWGVRLRLAMSVSDMWSSVLVTLEFEATFAVADGWNAC